MLFPTLLERKIKWLTMVVSWIGKKEDYEITEKVDITPSLQSPPYGISP